MIIIKKYSNRRLYDTSESRYVTLEELSGKIRGGAEVRVMDAKTEADLTQATLAQIILDGRRAAQLLPVPLLIQLIRMEDDALGEFFGTFVSWSLQMYQQTQRGLQAAGMYNPLAALGNPAINPFAKLFGGVWGAGPEPPPTGPPAGAAPPPYEPAPAPPPSVVAEPQASYRAERDDELAQLRRDMEELKAALRGAPTDDKG